MNEMTRVAEPEVASPDIGLARLVEGNTRFINGEALHRDLSALRLATASSQRPFAVVLSCIDSRSIPEVVFDQGIGDIFTARIAGNYSTPDMLGSMEIVTKLAGARLIVVMGHTNCAAVRAACDGVSLGNMATVVDALRPSVESVVESKAAERADHDRFIAAVAAANVRRTVERIRATSEILNHLERSGQIRIVGAMHDVRSGIVEFLD